jgi:hypothetical protein
MHEFLETILEFFGGREIAEDELLEKRRTTRIRCAIEVQVSSMKHVFPARIIDMGIRGARMEVPRRLNAGDKINVKLVQVSANMPFENDSLWMKVLWCRKRRYIGTLEAGASYDDTEKNMERSWVKYILRKIGLDTKGIFEHRKKLRVSGKVPLRYSVPGRQAFEDAEVINLGVGGLLADTDHEIRPGTKLEMKIGPYYNLDPIVLSGLVVSRTINRDTNRWNTAVQFLGLTDRQIQSVGKYVLTLLRASGDR